MRDILTRRLDALPAPDPALMAEARAAAQTGRAEDHARFLARIEALHALEQAPPQRPLNARERITVAAFNAERLKRPAAARALLDRIGAGAALLSEIDAGMARSANRHGPRALAEAAGWGYVFGVEFVELDLGDPREIAEHAGAANALGFHGNAILSPLALVDPHLIPLDESGLWFAGRAGAQHRIGGRIAVMARVAEAPKPLWLVAVHLESKTDPADRAAQMARLCAGIERVAPGAACVIGGDLNTKALPPEEGSWFEELAAHEPLFAHAARAGFDWRAANTPAPTQRTGPAGKPHPPFRKLDWLLTRGVHAENPRVVAALDGEGRAISDHEMVAADIVF